MQLRYLADQSSQDPALPPLQYPLPPSPLRQTSVHSATESECYLEQLPVLYSFPNSVTAPTQDHSVPRSEAT